MFSFKGQGATLAISPAYNQPMIIKNFSLVNKTGSNITANVYLISGIYNICIMPNGQSINGSADYEQERDISLAIGEQIKVQVSGQCDYDFNLINDKPDV